MPDNPPRFSRCPRLPRRMRAHALRAAPEFLKGKMGCPGKLGVKEARVVGVLLDVLAAIADLGTHQLAHGAVRHHGVFD